MTQAINHIERMIDELCPEGVEYRKLGEIAEIGTGSSNKQDADCEGQYPFYIRSKNIMRLATYEFDEEAIIIPGEGGVGEIFHYVNGKYALHQRVYRIHLLDDRLNTKFAYYHMQSAFKAFIMKKAVSATVTSIRKPMIANFEIPLPPLPIQREVARILDLFTALTAELTAELQARQKQYRYYRDRLLAFSHDDTRVRWMRLGEVCEIKSGRNKSKANAGAYPVYGSTGIIAYCDNYVYTETQILIARVGANAGYTYVGTGKYDVSDNTLIITPQKGINFRFMYHTLVNLNLNRFAKGGGQPLITASCIKKLSIPLPPIEEQRRIASILDRFERLTTDLAEGLPAEIRARRQQYEHYRDRLLTFKRKTT